MDMNRKTDERAENGWKDGYMDIWVDGWLNI
jgi:hypothetical protein